MVPVAIAFPVQNSLTHLFFSCVFLVVPMRSLRSWDKIYQ
jgi:hypothetical protein